MTVVQPLHSCCAGEHRLISHKAASPNRCPQKLQKSLDNLSSTQARPQEVPMVSPRVDKTPAMPHSQPIQLSNILPLFCVITNTGSLSYNFPPENQHTLTAVHNKDDSVQDRWLQPLLQLLFIESRTSTRNQNKDPKRTARSPASSLWATESLSRHLTILATKGYRHSCHKKLLLSPEITPASLALLVWI